jgi:hypothetical protein
MQNWDITALLCEGDEEFTAASLLSAVAVENKAFFAAATEFADALARKYANVCIHVYCTSYHYISLFNN